MELIYIPFIFAYIVVAGAIQRMLEMSHRRKCDNYCGDKPFGSVSRSCENKAPFWYFAGIVWPALIPLMMGMSIGNIPSGSGEAREARKQKKALAKADFMIELAKKSAIEAEYLAKAEKANPLSLSRL